MAQPVTPRGIPIRMPKDPHVPAQVSLQLPATRSIRKIRSAANSAPTSPRPVPKGLNRPSPAQIIVLKRKRHEEPLDGLLLELDSRGGSDIDLSRSTAAGETSPNDESVDEGKALGKASLRARKRKKVTSSRGFFQLADTVETTKWDDEAWRRDFNERVLAKSKENRKALAAAAGVPAPLDSPVLEKTSPAPASPLIDRKIPRRYTVVPQNAPQVSKSASKEKGKQVPLANKGIAREPSTATNASNRPDKTSIQYFNAVPVPDSAREKTEQEKQEDDDVAAFLPMLQDYLKLNDMSPAKIIPEKQAPANGLVGASSVFNPKGEAGSGTVSSDEDEYVYDVYFKGNHEPTSSDWNNLSNYGTLIGLPPEANVDDGDSDEIDANSDYDIDDDSNDEDFYRNDYPDEEDEESDLEESDDFYDDRDDSEEEEDYDMDAPWRHHNPHKRAI